MSREVLILGQIQALTLREAAALTKQLESTLHVSAVRPLTDFVIWDPLPLTLVDPPNHNVVLIVVGARRLEVIKVIRRATDLGLSEVIRLLENVPFVVKEKLTEWEAGRLRDGLIEVGATVEIQPT